MSYSAQATTTQEDAVGDVRSALAEVLGTQDDPEFRESWQDHFEHIATAVEALAPVLGRPQDGLVITVSGHGNPGHGPHPSWSDEHLSLTISVRAAADENGVEGDALTGEVSPDPEVE